MKKYLIFFALVCVVLFFSCTIDSGIGEPEKATQNVDLKSTGFITIVLDAGSPAGKGINIQSAKIIDAMIQLTGPTGDEQTGSWRPGLDNRFEYNDLPFGNYQISVSQRDDLGMTTSDSATFNLRKGYNYLITVSLGGRILIKVDEDSDFTIAVLSDTQNYVDITKPQPASKQLFINQTQYIVDQSLAQNIVFVSHVGDVVQHGDLYEDEWTYAYTAMEILGNSDIAFGMAPGNHDYDNYSHSSNNRPLKGSTKWSQYFGPDSPLFQGKSWYGTETFNGDLNSYQVFTACGLNFLHIALEQEASDEALDWATGVIGKYEGVPTIVTTHEYLSNKNDAEGNAIYLNDGYLNGAPSNNSAQQVWEKFISQNDQIFMVLCGHNFGSTHGGVSNGNNLRVDNNNQGHPVYQVLTDYQGNTADLDNTPNVYTGGAGWLRLMTFDLKDKSIHFQTYSTEMNIYAGVNNGPDFNVDPSLSDFTLPIPERVLN